MLNKNNDIETILNLPFENEILNGNWHYNFKKCLLIYDKNNDAVELIYDKYFKDLEYVEINSKITFTLEKSKSDFDIWSVRNRIYNNQVNDLLINLGSTMLNNYTHNDKIDLDSISLKIQIENDNPFNKWFSTTNEFYSCLGINRWELLGFKNKKTIPIGYKKEYFVRNKDQLNIVLYKKVIQKFAELDEYLIAFENRMILSISAITRFFIVHICKELFGEKEIIDKISTGDYKDYEKLINLLKSKRYIQKVDAKFIKKGCSSASKILHGSILISKYKSDDIEICFICLLKLIEFVYNGTFKKLINLIKNIKAN